MPVLGIKTSMDDNYRLLSDKLLGRQYPDLIIFGGIDKRVLAQGRKAIDDLLETIIPPMRARGGYIPTCDHGVPAEVPYQDYLYYRKRCAELCG